MKPQMIFAIMSVLSFTAFAQNVPGSLYATAKNEISKPAVAQVEVPEAAKSPSQKAQDMDIKGAVKMAKVFFVSPKNGDTVPKTFKVKMGLEGMKIRPAGEAPDEVVSGHHHLLVDGAAIPAGIPIPTDEKHIHFGKGQTETEVTLAPGVHTLTLQFADGAHRSFGEKMSATITVTVK